MEGTSYTLSADGLAVRDNITAPDPAAQPGHRILTRAPPGEGKTSLWIPNGGWFSVVGVYVMDGDIATAKSAVIALVYAQQNELKLTSGPSWQVSQFLPSEPDVHQTRHSRTLKTGAGGAFTLQHMFLSV